MENQSRYNSLEVTLCRYIRALERGDADQLLTILHGAEQDEVLERIIIEVHRTYRTKEDEVTMSAGMTFMRSLLQQYQPIWNPQSPKKGPAY